MPQSTVWNEHVTHKSKTWFISLNEPCTNQISLQASANFFNKKKAHLNHRSGRVSGRVGDFNEDGIVWMTRNRPSYQQWEKRADHFNVHFQFLCHELNKQQLKNYIDYTPPNYTKGKSIEEIDLV